MNISFFLDVKLVKKDNNVYTTGAVTKEYLNRHRLSESDKLTIICREDKNKDFTNKLALASDKNIEFIMFDSYKEAYKNRKLIKNIIKESDVVNVKLPTNIGIIAMHYVLKLRKKHLVQLVGCPYDILNSYGGIKAKLIAPIISVINKYYIKRADNIIYVTNGFLQERYPTKGKSISCSNVNIDNPSKEVLKNRLDKISRDINVYKIGLIGSLNVKYKGQDTAIKAISLLKNKFNIELHFLGSGDKENWIDLIKQYGVENRVFFDGTLPSGDPVYNWLDNMDIYLQPSLTEGLPRSVIEAMSRGCPVIGTEAGGIPELLQKELVIKKKDYKDLAIKIEKLLNDKKMMEKIAKENFEEAKKYNKSLLNEKRRKFIEEVYNNK